MAKALLDFECLHLFTVLNIVLYNCFQKKNPPHLLVSALFTNTRRWQKKNHTLCHFLLDQKGSSGILDILDQIRQGGKCMFASDTKTWIGWVFFLKLEGKLAIPKQRK